MTISVKGNREVVVNDLLHPKNTLNCLMCFFITLPLIADDLFTFIVISIGLTVFLICKQWHL